MAALAGVSKMVLAVISVLLAGRSAGKLCAKDMLCMW